MKQLKFDHEFVKDVLSGKKNTTIRIDDKHIVVNDRLQLIDKTSNSDPQLWEVPGELIIVGVQEFRLEKLPIDLLLLHGINIKTKPELYEFLQRYYGHNINENTVVKLISFEFDAYKQPVPYLMKKSLEENTNLGKVKLFADGGSRGNPGPSSLGFVIKDQHDNVIESSNKYLGITTNNQAEYHAVIAGLEWCKQHNVQYVEVFLDSLLVVNQMKGIFKVKNRELWALQESAKKLQGSFKEISFTHIPRELNKLADAEVNKVLDAIKGEDIFQ
jgi:ribonuclease HI